MLVRCSHFHAQRLFLCADDALPLLQGAVQGRTTALGPSHSDTLALQQAFAQCLLVRGGCASVMQGGCLSHEPALFSKWRC